MASSFTANAGIEKIGSGEKSGSWGTTTNTNFDIIDAGLHGQASVVISGSTDLTTTDGTLSNGMNSVIRLTGTPGSAFELRVTPVDQEKHFVIKNETNAQCTILYKGNTASNTNSVVIPVGATKEVAGDGQGASSGKFIELFSDQTDLVNDTTPQLGGNLDTNGNVIQFGSSKWTIELVNNDLIFKYNGTARIKFTGGTGSDLGDIVTTGDVTASGSI